MSSKAKKADGDSPRRYKLLLLEAAELQKQAGANVHARMTRLMAVFMDGEFRADNPGADDFALAEILDSYVADTHFTFLDLRTILAEFPDEAAWSTRLVSDLWIAAQEAARQRNKQEAEKPVRTRKSVTLAEYAALETKAQDLTAKVEHLKSVKSEAERLREENAALKCRVAALEAENQELRRQLCRPVEYAA